MQSLFRVFFRHIGHEAKVGENERVGSERDRIVGRVVPQAFMSGAHEGVERHESQYPPATGM